MNTMTEQATRFRLWYNRWAPLIMGVCLIIGATAAVVGALGLYRTSATQAEQARLLECFDRYAAVNSTSSQAVRAASVAKDVATAERDDALSAEGEAFYAWTTLLSDALANPKDFDQQEFTKATRTLNRTLAERATAARALDVAQAALDKARRENPVPDPPSEFCGSAADKEGASR